MYCSYHFTEISDFERAVLKQRFIDELHDLNEIQALLEEAFHNSQFSKKVYIQRIRAKKLVLSIESKIRQVEFDLTLKMVSLRLEDMKKVYKALKKRRISKMDPQKVLRELVFLEEKMKDALCRDAWGLEEKILAFPVSEIEVDILLETIAV